MNVLKKGTIIVFLAMLVVFGVVFIMDMMSSDHTRPQITFETDHLYLDAAAGEADLMQGVRAHDKKDGDLTARVIVESVSDQIEPGTVRVRYAVCDADGHVAEASRLLTYNGYAEPRFALLGDLVFGTGEKITIRDKLTATDAIGGDISERIALSSDDLAKGKEGEYTVTAQVMGSLGETVKLSLPVIVETAPVSAPTIQLNRYLVYLKTGDAFDAHGFIESVSNGLMPESVRVESNVDTSVPGVYRVDYRITDGSGNVGHTVLNVVVEERGEN